MREIFYREDDKLVCSKCHAEKSLVELFPHKPDCPSTGLGSLSPRERTVATLLSRGKRNKQIAEDLGVSVKTVDSTRRSIYMRLCVDNLAALTRVIISGEMKAHQGVAAEVIPEAEASAP